MQEPFFSDYLKHLETLRDGFHEQVEGLPTEAMDWVPGPEMNSIAVLLAHTIGSVRFWVGDIAIGDSSGRVREQEFQVSGLTGAELLGRLDAVIDYARKNLPRLSLADLAKPRATADRTTTCGSALLHALEHGSLHLGHIQLTAQLWKQRGR